MIRVDEQGVTRPLPGAEPQRVLWSDLREVAALTLELGSAGHELNVVLRGRGPDCLVSQSDPALPELLRRLQALPGFDNQAWFTALNESSPGEVVCWRRV